jgi:hypothetical protein
MRRLATTGTGTTAVQAARYLDEVARQDAQWVSDQGLLALLTKEQRACIEAHLRGEAVVPSSGHRGQQKPLQSRTTLRVRKALRVVAPRGQEPGALKLLGGSTLARGARR